MPRRVFNWNYNHVSGILKDHGFRLNHIESSHHFFVGTVNGKVCQVCVPKHGKKSFKPRTLKGMFMQSGLSKWDWGL